MKKYVIADGIFRMKFDSFDQWLGGRSGIGGSDASAVLGLNPYKSNEELWLEKTGKLIPEDISDKPYVQYGHAAEPILRDLFALHHPEYKVEYYDNNMIRNEKYPWAHASLDGELIDVRGRRGVLEIKTTNILQSMQREKWKSRIPDNYYIQVLHYLMVTEYDFAELKAELKSVWKGEIRSQIREYHIEREEVWEDIEYLRNKEEEFWKTICQKERPGLLLPEI